MWPEGGGWSGGWLGRYISLREVMLVTEGYRSLHTLRLATPASG